MSGFAPRWLKEWARGTLRFWTLAILMVGAFGAVLGVPHILTRYEYRDVHGRPVYLRCDYLGPFGTVRAVPGEDVRADCPGIAFFTWGYKGYYQR